MINAVLHHLSVSLIGLNKSRTNRQFPTTLLLPEKNIILSMPPAHTSWITVMHVRDQKIRFKAQSV